MAKVTPSGVQMNAYNPVNTAPAACPSVGSKWGAKSSPLPPVANPQLCSCMISSLTCTVADNVKSDDYGKLFGQVCGFNGGSACAGIQHNATTGVYGAYGMCNPKEQLAFALNAYYNSASAANKAQACNFGGSATTKAAASPTGSCGGLLQQAGAAGTGTVTSKPTGAGASASKKSEAGITLPSVSFGFLQFGAYFMALAAAGAGVVLM
jgi:1,3-beta-glucanosyltransferase GAS1